MAPVLVKSLSRLSRDSLIDLCLKWTQSTTSTPYLSSNRNLLESSEEDYLHEPADHIAALRELYTIQKKTPDDLSKRDIIDRIIDGDWRRGLSLSQLADIDFENLEANDTALRWSALKLVPYRIAEEDEPHPAKKRKIQTQAHYPSIAPANFISNLKAHVGPLVKAYYTLHKLTSGLVVVRLYIVPNTPFAPVSSNVPRNVRQATDSGRVMYIALPDSCPYVYISLTGGAGTATTTKSRDKEKKTLIDIAATKRVILESIPKALSKPQERWSIETTKLTCRSLKAIGLLRGNGRPGTTGGSYSKFSEEYEWKPKAQVSTPDSQSIELQSTEAETTPLTVTQPTPQSIKPLSDHEHNIITRFGTMTTKSHAKLDRFQITLTNLLGPPPTSKKLDQPPRRSKRKRRSLEDIEAGRDLPVETEVEVPKVEPVQITLSFSGVDVFRGLRELALLDGGKYVDLERLPAWATGEKGVSGLSV